MINSRWGMGEARIDTSCQTELLMHVMKISASPSSEEDEGQVEWWSPPHLFISLDVRLIANDKLGEVFLSWIQSEKDQTKKWITVLLEKLWQVTGVEVAKSALLQNFWK